MFPLDVDAYYPPTEFQRRRRRGTASNETIQHGVTVFRQAFDDLRKLALTLPVVMIIFVEPITADYVPYCMPPVAPPSQTTASTCAQQRCGVLLIGFDGHPLGRQ